MAAGKGMGLFSDIHGNRQAFATIIQIIKQRQELDWLCLGGPAHMKVDTFGNS